MASYDDPQHNQRSQHPAHLLGDPVQNQHRAGNQFTQTCSGQLSPQKTAPPAVVQKRGDGSAADPLPFTGIPTSAAEWAFLPHTSGVAPQTPVQARGQPGHELGQVRAQAARPTAVSAIVQMRDGDRERESADGELDRRLSGGHGTQSDGSGEWGADDDERGFTDRANHYMWTRVALAAESWGLTNAARHMRHYLGNTGAPLLVEVDLMLRDVAPLQEAYDAHIDSLRTEAEQHAANMSLSGPASFSLSTARMSDVYCSKGISADWFYAIGGFTYWVTADVTLTPSNTGEIDVTMVTQLHIFDRYNWDGGKSVTIAGMTVTDEQLGRLHRVGLAREYEVNGTSSPAATSWHLGATGATSLTQSQQTASARQGGRSDVSRERGRHFDNVRGSE
ncbi:MAG: hypothetical protein Tsb0020_19080 [Haliangiales bacterium]